jgi:hypothetical protein
MALATKLGLGLLLVASIGFAFMGPPPRRRTAGGVRGALLSSGMAGYIAAAAALSAGALVPGALLLAAAGELVCAAGWLSRGDTPPSDDDGGVVEVRGRLDDRLARARRVPDLKMPEPTKTPSAPSCIISAASAGVAMPPAVNSTTGSLPARRPRARARSGACSSLAATYSSVSSSDGSRRISPADRAHVADGLDDVAGAGLALGADHRRALGDAPQRLAEVGRAAHERHLERPLVDVVGLVGRRQHLGLVDVVDLERLQHLRLDEVADAALAITGIVTASWMPSIMSGSLMRATPPSRADVGRHALERHHGDGAGVLGDLRLLGVTTSMITPPLSISARPPLTRPRR